MWHEHHLAPGPFSQPDRGGGDAASGYSGGRAGKLGCDDEETARHSAGRVKARIIVRKPIKNLHLGVYPDLVSRIEFVILRMDRSPPAASHPASWRRSYSRLQAGERLPEEDFHLFDQVHS